MNKKKQIVVIGSGIPDMISKMAIGLRKKGHETIFISLVKNQETDFLKKAYDRIISFDVKFYKINLFNLPRIFLYGIKKSFKILKLFSEIKKLRPFVVISVATPNWLCFLARKYFKNYPFVYFPFDIRSFSYKDRKEALSFGIPNFELNAEKYCFKNADGIIHKGGEDELNFLNDQVLGEKIKIKCPAINIFPYCLRELMVAVNGKNKLSRENKEIHIVYVGHIPLDETWSRGMEAITKQGIYLHLYGKTANLTKEEDSKRVEGLYPSNNKFLCIHEQVPQENLSKEVSKYDYGIYGYKIIGDKRDETDTGNKLASYLEAGLPIITFDNSGAANNILKKYNVAVIIKRSQLRNLKKVLKKNLSKNLMKNIPRAREELGIEKNIPRLENFFEQVAIYKKRKGN
nr:hypothetical protein [uncultured archaeon]